MKSVVLIAVASASVLALAAPASATVYSGLTNTGGAGNSAWSVRIFNLLGQSLTSSTTPVDVSPINSNWVSNSVEAAGQTDKSAWIADQNYGDNGAAANPVYFSYSTTFSASNLTLGSLLGFDFAADNILSAVYLNGLQVYAGGVANNFAQWQNANVANVQSGLNTIRFDVLNTAQAGGNPTGFRLNWTSSNATAAVPEASTWAMMLGGFGMMGMAMRRRRTPNLLTA